MSKKRNTDGQEYFFLTSVTGRSITVERSWDYGHDPENQRYSAGNYFLSRETAEDTAAKISLFLQRKRKVSRPSDKKSSTKIKVCAN